MVLALAGCQPKPTSSAALEETATLGPQFSAKNGLLVPEATRRSLGMKIGEVTEQKIAATIEFQLCVYEVIKGTTLASGTVTSEQAKHLKPGERLLIRTAGRRSDIGEITALNEQLEKTTGTIEVLAEIRAGSTPCAVGDFLQASATLESSRSGLTVPRGALLQCSEGYSVYTVSGEHLVRARVKVGAVNG